MQFKRELFRQDMGDGTSRVWGNCVFTGQPFECRVPTEGLARFLAGDPIQRALPEESADIREWILSGISPAGWAATFGPTPESEQG